MKDLTLLKLFSNRSTYEKYIDYVQMSAMQPEINIILKEYKNYFDKFDVDTIDYGQFYTWFHQYRYPDLKESDRNVYNTIISKIPSAPTDIVNEVLKKFQEKYSSEKIMDHLDEAFSVDYLRELLDEYEQSITSIKEEEDSNVVKNNLEDFLEERSTTGLHWRLKCLNETVGPISRGTFIIVAAYVDVGKTMFAISEASYMARQLSTGTVLWLNNEEDDRRVYRKIWQSVLGCTEADLKKYPEKAKEEYEKRMGGDIDRIKFVNVRQMSVTQIKRLFKKYKPSLVVLDQVDKIQTPKYKSFSDHDRLKNLYGEMRDLANKYCALIAISQADVSTTRLDSDGDVSYSLYPHHRQLDGSKVGKPGEADVIIMIGKRAGSETTRGIHVSKNKFGKTIKQEVKFDGEKARYKDPSGGSYHSVFPMKQVRLLPIKEA